MAFLEDFKEKFFDLTRAGVAKSKQLAEIAKLKLANASEEDALKRAYLEIGRLYYSKYGGAYDTVFAPMCDKVALAHMNIEANNSRISVLESESEAAAPPQEDACEFDCCGVKSEPSHLCYEEETREDVCGCSGCGCEGAGGEEEPPKA